MKIICKLTKDNYDETVIEMSVEELENDWQQIQIGEEKYDITKIEFTKFCKAFLSNG